MVLKLRQLYIIRSGRLQDLQGERDGGSEGEGGRLRVEGGRQERVPCPGGEKNPRLIF